MTRTLDYNVYPVLAYANIKDIGPPFILEILLVYSYIAGAKMKISEAGIGQEFTVKSVLMAR